MTEQIPDPVVSEAEDIDPDDETDPDDDVEIDNDAEGSDFVEPEGDSQDD